MTSASKMLSCAILLALSASAHAGFTWGEGRGPGPTPPQPAPQPAPLFDAAEQAAIARAEQLIAGHPAAVLAAAGDSFVARTVIIDRNGTEHVRFARQYAGLDVIGGDFVLHSRAGQLLSVSGTLASAQRPALLPTVSADEAVVSAGARFGSAFDAAPTTRLVIYARAGVPSLAYEVAFSGTRADQTPTDMRYIVDAGNSAVIENWDRIQSEAAAGTARTLYSGDVAMVTNSIEGGFEMRDPSRGGGYTLSAANGRMSGKIFIDADNTWGNNAMSDPATGAADAQYGMSVTWDYFFTEHGRSGIADDGRGALNRVHLGRKFANAYWSEGCFCMSYGDGDGEVIGPLSSLDIAGHEMTHGVTNRSADLIYSGESGGLNEATSDIFGAMVEFYANNPNDPADYLMGERIFIGQPEGDVGLRYMYNPQLDQRSPNCYVDTLGTLDVHYSSGVANRFFYLLAEGSAAKSFNGIDHTAPTCNGGSVSGIGRDKAGAIWYRALTVYLTSSSNYAAARAATLAAADDLYGAASDESLAVAAAWAAVDVN